MIYKSAAELIGKTPLMELTHIEEKYSLKAKISLMKENNLAGIASWEANMAYDDIWTMFKNELNN